MNTSQSYLHDALTGLRVKLELPAEGQLSGPDEARLYKQLLTNLFVTQLNLGDAILTALWHVYINALVMYMGDNGKEYNPDEYAAWALETFEPICHRDDLSRLVYIIERIFKRVYTAQSAKQPYITSNGNPITIEGLLEGGVLSKLKIISALFESSDEAQRAELLDAVVTQTQRSVWDIHHKISGRTIITIPYIEIVKDNNLFDILLPNLTAQQVRQFTTLIGKAGVQQFTT